MAWLFDTNIVIHLRDGDPATLDRVRRMDTRPRISILSHMELEGGVYRERANVPDRRAALDRVLAGLVVLPFDEMVVTAYGGILAVCGYNRIRLIDRLIAATALVHDLTLATTNPADFRDIPGLRLEPWPAAQ